MKMCLVFFYFMVIWVLNNSGKLIPPIIQHEGCQYAICLQYFALEKLNNGNRLNQFWLLVWQQLVRPWRLAVVLGRTSLVLMDSTAVTLPVWILRFGVRGAGWSVWEDVTGGEGE